jgi:hypothetical protein
MKEPKRNRWKRAAASLAALTVAAALLSGCPRGQGPSPASTETVPAATARDPVQSVLASDVERAAGGSETLRVARASGIIAAAVDCERPPMCFRDEYGVARGFEPDLLKYVASALGAKINIVPPGDPSAVISAPSAPNDSDASVVYYYSAATGPLALSISGDAGFKNAVALVIAHLYETGAFGGIYKSWHNPQNN